MESLRQPDGLEMSGNLSENWKKFRQEFELYLVASGLDTKTDKQKVALLLHVAKKQAIDVYNTFSFEVDTPNYDTVVAKFESYCNPKKNETYERFVFNSRNQAAGESFEAFLTDVKTKAKTCGFGVLKDSMVRDRIVLGVTSQRVRERLLREEELSLDTAVKICKAAEITQKQIKSFTHEDAGVNAVKGQKRHDGWKKKHSTQVPGEGENYSKCRNCGRNHKPRACPAWNQTCHECGKRDHYARSLCQVRRQKQMEVASTQTVEVASTQTGSRSRT